MEMNQKLKWPLIAGHMVECFDNTLYGFFAVKLAPIFFPASSPGAELLASYGAFAAGFLARPLGAVLFGLIGDKKGRRSPLLWSMMLVGIPTFSIGLIPSFNEIGFAAPILLILCRLAQGLFMGGEFAGVNLYISENMPKSILGSNTGILIASGVFGAVFATLLGALVSMKGMPDWAWRIPFFFGGIAAFSVYLFRRKLMETKAFTEAALRKDLLVFPWEELFSNYKKGFSVACVIAGLTVMPLYFTTIFGNRFFKEIGFSTSESMLLNTIAMIFDGILIIGFGKLADKIGFYRQMLLGALTTAAIALPAFYLISCDPVTTLNVFMFIGLLVAVGCIINGCAMPYIASFFPTNCRYSGVALSVTIGHAVLGGTTPLMGSFLTDFMGTRIAPAFWLISVALTAACGILLMKTRTSSRLKESVV